MDLKGLEWIVPPSDGPTWRRLYRRDRREDETAETLNAVRGLRRTLRVGQANSDKLPSASTSGSLLSEVSSGPIDKGALVPLPLPSSSSAATNIKLDVISSDHVDSPRVEDCPQPSALVTASGGEESTEATNNSHLPPPYDQADPAEAPETRTSIVSVSGLHSIAGQNDAPGDTSVPRIFPLPHGRDSIYTRFVLLAYGEAPVLNLPVNIPFDEEAISAREALLEYQWNLYQNLPGQLELLAEKSNSWISRMALGLQDISLEIRDIDPDMVTTTWFAAIFQKYLETAIVSMEAWTTPGFLVPRSCNDEPTEYGTLMNSSAYSVRADAAGRLPRFLPPTTPSFDNSGPQFTLISKFNGIHSILQTPPTRLSRGREVHALTAVFFNMTMYGDNEEAMTKLLGMNPATIASDIRWDQGLVDLLSSSGLGMIVKQLMKDVNESVPFLKVWWSGEGLRTQHHCCLALIRLFMEAQRWTPRTEPSLDWCVEQCLPSPELRGSTIAHAVRLGFIYAAMATFFERRLNGAEYCTFYDSRTRWQAFIDQLLFRGNPEEQYFFELRQRCVSDFNKCVRHPDKSMRVPFSPTVRRPDMFSNDGQAAEFGRIANLAYKEASKCA